MTKTTNSSLEDLLMLGIRNQMGDLSGGSASSTSSSSYYSINSTPHSHSPSSSEGLIDFGSDSPKGEKKSRSLRIQLGAVKDKGLKSTLLRLTCRTSEVATSTHQC